MQQQRGMQTFAHNGCIACHSGANFSGPALPLGTGFIMKFPAYPNSLYVAQCHLLDDGGKAVQSGKIKDQNMWRVPSLRNLTYTAPYLHSGLVLLNNELALQAKRSKGN
ncbi:hypothetical protein [Zhongshania sp. BJYM1]|uniref:hypothetical protein n=1 Tax=Zhongshania aquatica TaxID=2965069 RepID=UPI0022B3E439|nr:hypothetical protein [Marortus sp. BJYM1]